MGKTRAYKHRLDKYYHLARQTGYRSRAAFKLIQLNQQYDFLSTANVCIDLCAAPGGWSQVASKYMPVGSTIVAIDLAPIKDIPHVVTIQADITSPKTHARVRKIIQGNKADVVLNDGAPNVGAAWITDSSNQLDLCLASLKVSTLFLKKGGSFVTKVFRSEHYNSLLWVLNQFFDKVHSTKPKASRDSSAEFFIVALGFKAPENIDPRLLDSTYVFSDIDELMSHQPINAQIQDKMTAIDFTSVSVADFLKAPKAQDVLLSTNVLTFDSTPLSQAALLHPATTTEIKALCSDLKVVGFSDRKVLMKWRKKMRDALVVSTEAAPVAEVAEVQESEHDSDEEVEAALQEIKAKKKKIEKAERKHRAKLRDQLLKRLQKNLNAANAEIADPKLRYGKLETPEVIEEQPKSFEEIVEENIEMIYEEKKKNSKAIPDDAENRLGPQIKFARHVEIDENAIKNKDSDKKDANMWYNQTIFDNDSDESSETQDEEEEDESDEPILNQEEDSQDEGALENLPEIDKNDKKKEELNGLMGQSIKSFDTTAYTMAKKIHGSKKAKEAFIDDSFNRFLHDEDDSSLPSWFVEDEKQANIREIPITKDDVSEYHQYMKDINDVDTKRVIEARMRKRQKALKKMKALQEKIDDVAEKEGLNERSKLRLMERIRDRGMKEMKPEPTVVVTQKRDDGKAPIPKHSKNSRVVFVDKRFKKDLRAQKKAAERPKGVNKKKKSKFIHKRK